MPYIRVGDEWKHVRVPGVGGGDPEGAVAGEGISSIFVQTTEPPDEDSEDGDLWIHPDEVGEPVKYVQGGYEIQVDGEDGEGIINFKTE